MLALSFLELVVTDVFEFATVLTDFLYAVNGGLNLYAAAVIFVVGQPSSPTSSGVGTASCAGPSLVRTPGVDPTGLP